MVYGRPGLGEIGYLVAESANGTTAVFYAAADLGTQTQTIPFASLVDHRGNHLPVTIDVPRVIPRPRADEQVFVHGEESDSSFTVARCSDSAGPVMTDFIILEMGR
jgi:hypothetical protein